MALRGEGDSIGGGTSEKEPSFGSSPGGRQPPPAISVAAGGSLFQPPNTGFGAGQPQTGNPQQGYSFKESIVPEHHGSDASAAGLLSKKPIVAAAATAASPDAPDPSPFSFAGPSAANSVQSTPPPISAAAAYRSPVDKGCHDSQEKRPACEPRELTWELYSEEMVGSGLPAACNIRQRQHVPGKELPEGIRSLNISGCGGLTELPEGIESLTGLQTLNFINCEGLKKLPDGIGSLTGLWTLDLSGCKGLVELPDGIWSLAGLQLLNLSCCGGLTELPEGIGSLARLLELNINGCLGLKTLPGCIGSLMGLRTLDLSQCKGLKKLPDGIGLLTGLRTLNLIGCDGLTDLPLGIWSLTGLNTLNLSLCEGMTALPEGIWSLTGLQMLHLILCEGLTVLPEGIESLTGLQTLGLVCRGLTELPEGIWSLAGLLELNLSGCTGLKMLAKCIRSLTGLRTLDLSHCEVLTELPEGIGSLTGLRTLILSGCEGLAKLPEGIWALAGLRTLNFKGCEGLKELPEGMRSLTGLQTLVLSGCKGLTELPDCIWSLTGLQNLDLSHCDGLTDLPKGIGSMTGIQMLNLSGCGWLTELPVGILLLKGLRTLNLSLCEELTELPDGIGSMTGLLELNLSGCEGLTKLPEGITSLTGLQTLNFINCEKLKELPNGIGALTGLRTLILDGCDGLKELPDGIGLLAGLLTLDLSGCEGLTELPKGIGSLLGLRTLNLSGCKGLTELPEGIGPLMGLRELNLSGCEGLTELPHCIGSMTGLRTLDLSHCEKLTALPEGIGSLTGLQKLDLGGCKGLKALPECIGSLTELKSLVLSGCKGLTELPDSIRSLTGLHKLDLGGCDGLTELPDSIGSLTELKSLVLSGCRGLKKLPLSLMSLVNLVSGRPGRLSCLPDSLQDADWKAVMQYLGDSQKGSTTCKLAKIMLVGPERAGKSSLVDSLANGTNGVRPLDDRTVGIDIRRWRLDDTSDVVAKKSDVVANVYDAAGQKVYRATHHIFFSEETLFLNVVKLCRGELQAAAVAESVATWLDAVQSISRSITFIQFTHAEIEDGEDISDITKQADRVLHLVYLRLKESVDKFDTALKLKEKKVFKQWCEGKGQQWVRKIGVRDKLLEKMGCLVRKSLQCSKQLEEHTFFELLDKRNEINKLHEQLDQLLCEGRDDESGVLSQLQEITDLRQRRLRLPMVLGCMCVSSMTGHGINSLRTALREALESEKLFPQLFRSVPTSYVMLEQLARQGRERTFGGGRCGDPIFRAAPAVMTEWEQDLTKKIDERASKELKELCCQPVVSLTELAEEADKCGIAQDELKRALGYLHCNGSVLYYPEKGDMLSEYVFMQPQWIIDAIKYVIREKEDGDTNDELRKMDEKIQNNPKARLWWAEFRDTGELRAELVREHLWEYPMYQEPHPRAGQNKFPSEGRDLLLELMESFNLLIQLEDQQDMYMVPAMLEEDSDLPDEYIMPHWFCPAKATGAPATMRRLFRTTRLPFGFVSQLQVTISTRLKQTRPTHKARGSFVSQVVGDVHEFVVISICLDQTVNDPGIRVMGWVTPSEQSKAEATGWKLFKQVIMEIESLVYTSSGGLSFDEYVPIMDKVGEKMLKMEPLRSIVKVSSDNEQIMVVDVSGEKKEFDMHDLVPCRTPLKIRTGSLSHPAQGMHSPARKPTILGFYAEEKAGDINVNGEAQKFSNILRRSSVFDTDNNTQPRFKDFQDSLRCAKDKNVTIVHMAGHADTEKGFYFLTGKEGKERCPISPEILSESLGSKCNTRDNGTVECVVLNACNTERFGQLLRKQGLSYVVCWQGKVDDQAAMEFSKEFYKMLEQCAKEHGGGGVPPQGYAKAFKAGQLAVRAWQETAAYSGKGPKNPNAGVFLSEEENIPPDPPMFEEAGGGGERERAAKGVGEEEEERQRGERGARGVARGGEREEEGEGGAEEREEEGGAERDGESPPPEYRGSEVVGQQPLPHATKSRGWRGIFWIPLLIAIVSMILARKRRWRERLLGFGGDRKSWKAVLAVVASLGAVVVMWVWRAKLSTWRNVSKRRVHDATEPTPPA